MNSDQTLTDAIVAEGLDFSVVCESNQACSKEATHYLVSKGPTCGCVWSQFLCQTHLKRRLSRTNEGVFCEECGTKTYGYDSVVRISPL